MKRYPLILFLSLSLLLIGYVSSEARGPSFSSPEELKGLDVADRIIASRSEETQRELYSLL